MPLACGISWNNEIRYFVPRLKYKEQYGARYARTFRAPAPDIIGQWDEAQTMRVKFAVSPSATLPLAPPRSHRRKRPHLLSGYRQNICWSAFQRSSK
jgi:hypothetical protein